MTPPDTTSQFTPQHTRRILCLFPEYAWSFATFNYAFPLMGSVKAFMPPQGIVLIAALVPARWEVRFIDENVRAATEEDLRWADVVFTTGMHIQRERIQDIIVRAHQAGRSVVLGAPSASSGPEWYPEADIIHCGEAGDATRRLFELIDRAPERQKITAVLKKYDVLLVADEVICGFGRTGNWWGTQTFGLQPDIITMAKQLSAGQLPIAAILINQRVFEALRDNSNKHGGFAHGLTYSGHPVASAVALETIKIYEDLRIVDHVRSIAPHFAREMDAFADHPLVGEVRKVGLVGAIELVKDKATHASFDPKLAVGPTLVKFAHEHGLIVRPVVDSLCFCPPMVSTEAQLTEMFSRFGRALKDTHDWLKREGHVA